ncbi:23S rRNA (uracil(1939)-C(5))-methyltransferase RlmD [Gilliamella sp. Pas-s95]|uniref:23S rRNA (uracil(1939)-C(5))-methyltransferase RlmD n=1 Tax=Gilliamella sp. Pas-s95 TaxID=2687317 RepID=UPI0013246697|nr:23S rRNA (uracil(1939)-C(5))-methyltransferase RlmD [Gilliamella sp. Pas-s95]MWN06162.1 23S rRNA (uracil(1939)-C(5))-methyltransferase RlmD [Gilliamella sp. Pas-s95]
MVNFYTPQKKKYIPQKLTVTVSSLDAFGQGVANHKGKTIFVKSALPDETVDIELTENKKNYAKARVIRYHNQSKERVKPQCEYYEKCGGCELQHMAPHLQQQAKYDSLIKLLQKETGQPLANILQHSPQIIADQPYHYRRRARLSINIIKGELVIGFRQAESNQITNIKHCPVLVVELDSLLAPLQNVLNRIKQKKALGHIELISVDSGIIIVLRHTIPLTEHDVKLLKTFAEDNNISLYFHGKDLVHIAGSTEHFYLLNHLKLTFSPLDFIQVNCKINQKMIAQTLNWLALKSTDQVLDLFCGMGNFSLPMATLCKSVTGVEGIDALVEKAKFNTILNNNEICAETNFLTSNLDDNQQFSIWSQSRFNKVLLDPARAGALNATIEIVKLAPSKIVYISCNPATLARDSKQLIKAGYQINKVAILDMFPQTKHIESMLLLTKSGT